MYGDEITHVPVLHYLGVWFDRSLTWGHQVTVATARARERLWLVRRLGGRAWGLHPHLFLRLVRGVVLPLLFFGAPCWASVLRHSSCLSQVDAVLALAARMAYRLERTISMEASLAFAGILPARQQILRRLLRYLWRRDREALTAPHDPIPERHVLPSELGRVFFQRSVLGHTLSTSLPTRRAITFGGIDRALYEEWQRQWRTSATGARPSRGSPEGKRAVATGGPDGSGSTWDCTLVAHFFTGHCHIGDFQTPWHEDEAGVGCPFCDETFTRVHLVWECVGVTREREGCFGGTLPDCIGDWSVFLGRGATKLGCFLWAVGLLVDHEESSEVS